MHVHVSILQLTVQELTGITTTLIQCARPLSVVFPEFLKWVDIITKEVSKTSGTIHVPGIIPFD